MKIRVIPLLFIIALFASFVGSPKQVQAAVPNEIIPIDETSHWNIGNEINIDLMLFPAPPDRQMIGKAVVIIEPTTICHPFDKGRFGWTGEIYKLVEGSWVKVPTTVGWVPDEEGDYKACTNDAQAGTYALFAYFTRPDTGCQYNTGSWYGSWFDSTDYPELYPGMEGYYLDAYVGDLPVGTRVTYKIISIDGYVVADGSGSTLSYLYDGESMWADFVNSSPLEWDGYWEIVMRISAAGCSKVVTVSSGY